MRELLKTAMANLDARREAFDDQAIGKAWVEIAKAQPRVSVTTAKDIDIVVARRPIGANKVEYEAYLDGRKPRVAWMYTMAPMLGRVQVTNANVYEVDGRDWRRHGIGTAIYDIIERDVLAAGGQGVEPHWGSMSDEAIEFWKQRRPEHADKIELLEKRMGVMASGLFD